MDEEGDETEVEGKYDQRGFRQVLRAQGVFPFGYLVHIRQHRVAVRFQCR